MSYYDTVHHDLGRGSFQGSFRGPPPGSEGSFRGSFRGPPPGNEGFPTQSALGSFRSMGPPPSDRSMRDPTGGNFRSMAPPMTSHREPMGSFSSVGSFQSLGQVPHAQGHPSYMDEVSERGSFRSAGRQPSNLIGAGLWTADLFGSENKATSQASVNDWYSAPKLREGQHFYGSDKPRELLQEDVYNRGAMVYVDGGYSMGRLPTQPTVGVDVPGGMMAQGATLSKGEIARRFCQAQRLAVSKLNPETPEVVKMLLYGFYQQAIEGDVFTLRPTIFETWERKKWDAWNANYGMSREEAMRRYIWTVPLID